MLNNTTAGPESCRPWSLYKVAAPEEHLSGSVLPRSGTRVGPPEEPGAVLLRSWLLKSRGGDSAERPSPTYPYRQSTTAQKSQPNTVPICTVPPPPLVQTTKKSQATTVPICTVPPPCANRAKVPS